MNSSFSFKQLLNIKSNQTPSNYFGRHRDFKSHTVSNKFIKDEPMIVIYLTFKKKNDFTMNIHLV